MEVNSYKLLQEGTNPKRKGISLPHSRMLFRSTSIQIVRKKERKPFAPVLYIIIWTALYLRDNI